MHFIYCGYAVRVRRWLREMRLTVPTKRQTNIRRRPNYVAAKQNIRFESLISSLICAFIIVFGKVPFCYLIVE